MSGISRDSVIKAAKAGAKDFRGLAKALGAKWTAEWEAAVRSAVNGIGDLLCRNAAVEKIRACRVAGDAEGVASWRRAIMTSILRCIDAGLPTEAPAMMPSGMEPAAEAPAAAKPKAAKPAGKAERKERAKEPKKAKARDGFDPSSLSAVGEGEVDGRVMPPLAMGYTGAEYHGRKVVAVRRVAGIFGTKAGERGGPQLCTLRNGILNQCSMREPPTPYWAVLDAASGLKAGFTKEQVVEAAMKLLGKDASCSGIQIAWDVLKNHQYHPRKRDCGMGFVIDQPPGRASLMSIRARDEGETQAYFESQRVRARDEAKPPKAAGPEPAEAKPVAVLVEKKT